MKLNYRRTMYVGFAFFLICAFWQAYDTTIPLILTNQFGLSQTASGVVMALDNVLALFLLPLFGAISDRCRSRRGRRTPFILAGTLAAVVAFMGLACTDGLQRQNLSSVIGVDDPAARRMVYVRQADTELQYPDSLGRAEDGRTFILRDLFTEDEFSKITAQLYYADDGNLYTTDETQKPLQLYPAELTEQLRSDPAEFRSITRTPDRVVTNPQYTNYVVPARDACVWQTTAEKPLPLVLFVVLLLITLVAMATFRSPAVALMPDVTVKPLRSKANAVINLMGSAGGTLVLVLGMVFATGSVRNSMMGYLPFFGAVAALMLLALAVFLWRVREPRFVREMEEESRRLAIDEAEPDLSGDRKLSKAERRSLIFLLTSIVFWFMGYNAVTSKYSVYATRVLDQDYNLTLIIAQAAAIAAYLPVGVLSSKLGRKKTILIGIVLLTASFLTACFLTRFSPGWLMNVMFVVAGVGWATINVNSFPMVVEMSRGSDVGKFTGIYYAASMAAQAVTPWVSGALMDRLGLTVLFPYAVVFVALAFGTMLFVRHGDNKPAAKKGLEALNVED
ncbi:MAG: MFS transporter [Oscillospiraceae bacterium]|nr:MFS transporter [Oscillospiraceae bacterium]